MKEGFCQERVKLNNRRGKDGKCAVWRKFGRKRESW
jgi:hypothetical protein